MGLEASERAREVKEWESNTEVGSPALKVKGREDVRVFQGLEQGLVCSELH